MDCGPSEDQLREAEVWEGVDDFNRLRPGQGGFDWMVVLIWRRKCTWGQVERREEIDRNGSREERDG